MAEILKIREITIDTMQRKNFNIKEEELKLIRFFQNDLNSAKLLINVTHDKVVTDFSSATSVQIAFLKPDGKRVFQDVQNVNQMQGKYYVVLSTQTLIAYGNVIAQLRFTFPNNKVIETCMFAFTVDESIMSDDAMKSTNEFPVIQKAIEAGKKFEGVDIDGVIAAGELAKGALPKSGGTMTGALNVNAPLFIKSKDGVKQYSFETDANGKLWFSDKNTPKDIFTVETDGTFRVAGSTNLLKKTGDTMTGHLAFGNNKELQFKTDAGVMKASIAVDGNGNWFAWNSPGSKYLWKLDGSTGEFVVYATVKHPKDGRANLTLTADATTPMTGNEPRAIRRGNTVTLIGSIRRNAGSTGNIVTTLPVDMRPIEDTNFVAQATDGTAVQVFIGVNSGNVTFSVPDKHVLLCQTYVVN